MAEFDHLPIVFKLARERDGKTMLTWDEYKRYRESLQVQDFFVCLDSIEVDGEIIYIDCVTLRQVGSYSAGHRFDYIGFSGSLYKLYKTEVSEKPVLVLSSDAFFP